MDRVGAPPKIVGRDRQDAERSADPIVSVLAWEERSVPAIVLDQKQANEQPGGQRRERERQPEEPVARGEQHRTPDRDKGREGDDELEDSARRTWLAGGHERLRPVAPRPDRAFRFRHRHVASARYAL